MRSNCVEMRFTPLLPSKNTYKTNFPHFFHFQHKAKLRNLERKRGFWEEEEGEQEQEQELELEFWWVDC